jgi:hypothetical protein
MGSLVILTLLSVAIPWVCSTFPPGVFLYDPLTPILSWLTLPESPYHNSTCRLLTNVIFAYFQLGCISRPAVLRAILSLWNDFVVLPLKDTLFPISLMYHVPYVIVPHSASGT